MFIDGVYIIISQWLESIEGGLVKIIPWELAIKEREISMGGSINSYQSSFRWLYRIVLKHNKYVKRYVFK